MKIQISAKNYTVSNKLKDIIEKKVGRLERYFSENADAKIFCRKDNGLCRLELTIKDGGMLFRSEVTSENMYQNVDMALPKVEKQIIKYSSKLKDKFHKKVLENKDWLYFEDDAEEIKPPVKQAVTRVKKFDIVPLSVEDAQMYLENSDHSFYIYLNQETGKVNIMYRREMGGYGIIEPTY